MSPAAIELNPRESTIVRLLTDLENTRRLHKKMVPVRIMPDGDQSVDLDNIEEVLRRKGIYLYQYGDKEIEGAIDIYPIAPPQADEPKSENSSDPLQPDGFAGGSFSDIENLFGLGKRKGK